ncbi:4577_t:CDS:2 [Racocetra fulgida]|uniref:4577_t:CDS:1 n=1 Tax=Racocetra fulgida TaxID=60492 RepID=A0A9N9F885_9GLOM|nr:4577_t:CDS:2 [Racocetra fulgida]
MTETSEERRKRLNRERQQRYHKKLQQTSSTNSTERARKERKTPVDYDRCNQANEQVSMRYDVVNVLTSSSKYLAETASNETSTLTAWFKANSDYPDARNLIYENFSSQWVFDKRAKLWKPRKPQLRNLFATLLLFCDLLHPEQLWEKYIYFFSEDIRFHTNNNNEHPLTQAEIHNLALLHLQSILRRHGKSLANFPNMPIPITLDDTNSLIHEEQNYDIDELIHILEHGIPQLNEDQLTIFNKVINAVESKILPYSSLTVPVEQEKHSFIKGRIPTIGPEHNKIQLSEDLILPFQQLNDLIQFVYPEFSSHSDSQYLVERAILTPKNEYCQYD